MQWRKSSRSGPWTDNCVEVAFEKSSFSTNQAQCVEVGFTKSTESSVTDACVEVGKDDVAVHVRDSKNPEGPCLHFTKGEWDAFIEGVHKREFDLV
jgi:Domain of unknown function (DUF397)